MSVSRHLLKNINYISQDQGGLDKLAFKLHTDLQSIQNIVNGRIEATLNFIVLLSEVSGYSLNELVFTDLEVKNKTIPKLDIKLLIIDIDGVMTDGGMYYTESGDEFKKFNTKDGIAIKKAKKAGIKIGFLSSGFNHQLIKNRGNLLGVDLIHSGENPKIEVLDKWVKMLDIEYESVAYIGDDVNDLQCMQKVGLTACPSDAAGKIKEISNIILMSKGGYGCVREFCEKYLELIK